MVGAVVLFGAGLNVAFVGRAVSPHEGYSRSTPHRIEEGIHHLATILNSDGVIARPAGDDPG